ncbi:methionyl-tRNA formyltransferase [Pseudoflavitalea sp. G-6-1-2]|uniref:methionyl-tRNA formyltransferase n=1 Tax=Pseudoflavitalea sp. G-6-1-2 TaxID=2728841 RepID=UPI001F0D0A9F|nr:methionyl-tRNA formyltransferase [Pseudoflavitalea sp. G-6-1-2]
MQKSFEELRIVFMGTPEFAVASLDALIQAGANIVGVVTAPDKPAGRGMKLTESAVKKYAAERGLNLLQPEKLRDPQFLEALQKLQADLQIVVAFRMLPEVVWNMPPMGTLNVHGSLLPHYRGAAPINWAVINGEKYTGVTTFQLQHAIDTGNILLQEKFAIGDNDTAGDVHDTMKNIGADLLVRTVQQLAEGSIKPIPQQTVANEADLKHAPKLFTETAKINWEMKTDQVFDLIRGLSPYPSAFTHLQDKTLKIFRASKEHQQPELHPGAVLTDHKTFLKFATSDGYIHVLELQLEGKKRMTVEDFLRGYRF